MKCNLSHKLTFKQLSYFLRLLGGALFVLEGVDRVGLLMLEDLGVS